MKAVALATLSVAPFGSRLYRRLQDTLGTARLDVNADYGYGSKPGFLKKLQEHGVDLGRSDVLEIGTGWHGVLPLLLSLSGTRSIATIDLNPWLTPKSLDESLSALHAIADRIESDLGVAAATTRTTLSRMRGELVGGATVRDVLSGARITYHAPLNLMQTSWPAGSFDAAVSSNVLEHIAPDALQRMKVELRRIVRPGGVVLHHVHPGDHFAGDERITTGNFLRYAPLAWRLIGGWKLSYHNRLRCVDYTRMMANGGFHVENCETRLDQRALDAVRSGQLRPHAEFGKYNDVELCEDLITVVARRLP